MSLAVSPLYCRACHTRWEVGVLMVGAKCPFRDCAGRLTAEPPATMTQPVRREKSQGLPLFDRDGD
jgi:hypothetical protein